MLDDLNSIPWSSIPQPEWNGAGDVPNSIRRLAAAASADDAHSAYHSFLFAVGNDHGGSYYPVVLPTIPFLMEILGSCGAAAQVGVRNVLIDLVGSFGPDPNAPATVIVSGTAVGLKSALLTAVAAYLHELPALLRSPDPEVSRLARDLIALFPARRERHSL
jgi:hypothetical protein